MILYMVVFLIGALVTGAAVYLVQGSRWRGVMKLFAIRETTMTLERLGFDVTTEEHRAKVEGVLQHFAGGFNRMICDARFASWKDYCNALPSFYRPFAHEGAAMGYPLRRLGMYSGEAFEAEVVRAFPQYRYLYYVGLGFWGGMRGFTPSRMCSLTRELDPLYRYLCYDGYGFKHGFFGERQGKAVAPLMRLEGYARHAAFQGLGRSLYFHYMDADPEVLVDRLRELNEYGADAASGVGLASVFINDEQLDVAIDLAARMDAAWQPAVQQGMCFGLKARCINDVERFENWMQNQPACRQEAVYTAIRECDRIELQVRDEGREDAYRQWRERLAFWMEAHVDYPLGPMKPAAPDTSLRGVRGTTED